MKLYHRKSFTIELMEFFEMMITNILECFLILYYVLFFLENENRYEGQWKDGMKHGEGKFYHYSKGQVFVGTWLNDVAKCGVMKDFNRETADEATQYPLPEV